MVKIEKLLDGAKATIMRDGVSQKVFLNQLISREELETMEVTEGTVVYSIDEEIVAEKSAGTVEPPKTVEVATTTTVEVTDTVEPVKIVQPAKPVIVQPVSRTTTKK